MNKIVFLSTLKAGLQLFLILALSCLSLGTGSVNVVYASPLATSAPPSNDDFANATLINGLTFSDAEDTTGATTAVTDPSNIGPCDGKMLQQGGQSVWYKYTPAANESIAADTSGSSYDTFMAIWTGSEGSLSPVTCDDDGLIDLTSQLSFVATAGTTYYFEVAAYTGIQGQPPQPSFGGDLSFHVNISNLDVLVGTSTQRSYYVNNNSTITDAYPAIIDGPVKVKSTVGDSILTSQRVSSGDSYNELVGFPANQITTEYWFPYYDHGYPNVAGSNMRTWILVGNPSDSQTATVNIYIGGKLMSGSPFLIGAGKNVTPRWIGTRGGPVQVVSDIPIFASERVLTSNNSAFNEILGYAANQFTTEYWFPWYDSKNMQNFILVGNTNTTKSASVRIYIAGVQKAKFTVAAHSTVSKSFNGLINGPVRVVSTNGINIVTSQKTISGTSNSYNEVLGYPFNQFAIEYWFPFYDHGYPNVFGSNMRTWVLVGNPSTSQTALVQIYIGGVLQHDPNNLASTTFSIAPGKNVTPRWLGTQGGPVHVVSNIPIIASERVFTFPNSVFNEMMGYPANQLTTEYWYPWYDSINTNNDILIIKP